MYHSRERNHTVELNGNLAEFRQALENEIDKIKENGQSSTLLFGGRRNEGNANGYWYKFNVEYAPTLPADTPCKLLIGKDEYDVTVISFEENSIILSSSKQLPDTIAKARLENGATILMERLIKCIEENAGKANPVGNRMLPADDSGNSELFHVIAAYSDITPNLQNTPSQNAAVSASLSNDITYIWGPPGTGKTTIIGQIIDELYKHDRSVLLVSHTNTAVDGAITKVTEIYNSHQPSDDRLSEPYPILRIGNPTRTLPSHVLLSSHIATLGKGLYEQKQALEKQQADIQMNIKCVTNYLAKYNWISESRLSSIKCEFENIKNLETDEASLSDDLMKSDKLLTKAKIDHPEYLKYFALQATVNVKIKDNTHLLEQISTMGDDLKCLTKEIQSAEDEVKKHERYETLKAEEAKQMSEAFLRGEISKNQKLQVSLNLALATLNGQQIKLKGQISNYDQKNIFGKLLSRKSVITQARKQLSDIMNKIPQTIEDINVCARLEDKYKKQLEDLLFLHGQIKSLEPTKSKSFWIARINKLTDSLHGTQIKLPVLQKQQTLIFAELTAIKKEMANIGNAAKEISQLEDQNLQIHKAIQKLSHTLTTERNKCSEHLERERSLCLEFACQVNSTDIHGIFNELNSLFEHIKGEVNAINPKTLLEEKALLQEELAKNYAQLAEVSQKMQELECQAIMQAKIVGATLAKSYLSNTLRKRTFDTVILDEASMASIPALWCACYLATQSVIIVGDFLQLAPIVMADTPMATKWLGKDIFYQSGVQEKAKNHNTRPANFVMLSEQFRMEKEIANIANMYYGEYGLLHSDDTNETRNKERDGFYSWYPVKRSRHCVHMIDTESLHAWVTGVPQGKNHSRFNCFSAAVDVALAFKFIEKKLNKLDPKTAKPEKDAVVLIVAPYKPHVAYLKQLIDLEYKNLGFDKDIDLIRAGTIHSFQGNEADIVIFDLVIDEPHWKANLFMPGKEINDNLRKMFNVAITRAKFKLFIVGNFEFCLKRAKNNALAELLDRLFMKDNLPKIDAKEMLPNLVFAPKKIALEVAIYLKIVLLVRKIHSMIIF